MLTPMYGIRPAMLKGWWSSERALVGIQKTTVDWQLKLISYNLETDCCQTDT